jgi:hypothetical protein
MIVSGLVQNILTVVIVIVAASTQHAANAMFSDQTMEPVAINLTSSTTSDSTTYIISFKDKGQSPAKRCEALAKLNRGTVQYVYDQVLNGCSLTVPVGDAPAAFNAFKKNPIVSMVEEDQVISLDDPNEEHIFNSTNRMLQEDIPWGLDRINQCALPLDKFATKQDASGVRVFIIDTGIYAAHTEFAGLISSEKCHATFAGGNALKDDNGHG